MWDERMHIASEDECWQWLAAAETGRLAVVDGTAPDIFPVNYVVDGHSVVFRTAEGTKLAAAVLMPAVAFEADGDDGTEAWSVVLKGRAREIEDMDDLFAALDLPLYPWHDSAKHRFVRVEPTEITGRRFHVDDRRALHEPEG